MAEDGIETPTKKAGRKTSLDEKFANEERAPEHSRGPFNSDPNSTLKTPAYKKKVQKFIDHWSFTVWMTVLTIYALFGDDIRLAATDKDSDNVFYSLSVVCLFFFTLEIVLGCVAKEGYLLSFFFWLDVIATLSLIPDIGWIWDEIIGESASGNDATQASKIARAGRASRAGTRAGRIIRILRVIRLIRIVKLYKLSQEAKNNTQSNGGLRRTSVVFRGASYTPDFNFDWPDPHSLTDFQMSASQTFKEDISVHSNRPVDHQETPEEEEFKPPEETKVGKKLSELTTKRVIMLVLGMLFLLPLFYTTMWLDVNTSYQYGIEVLDRLRLSGSPDFNQAWKYYIDEHKDLNTPLIYLEIENTPHKWETSTSPDELRSTEKELVTLSVIDENYEYAPLGVFDLRSDTRLEAWLNMCRTVFVCVVLSVSSILFSKDTQELVLEPIENMIEKVKKMSKNPLKAVQEEEREKLAKKELMQEEETKNKNMETAVLENTLSKIGALLALGFGEAGSEIIAANMQRGSGDVDPMIPGKKSLCIFGFCDIRNFTDATEILQKDVMVFVNEIAHVVHKIVDNFSGNANKNIGDAFLLVWKFPEEFVLNENQQLKLSNHNFVRQLADMSVISFLKIIAEINKNPKILKYKEHPGLNQRMPGYSVKMGFGLHQGWAIEGAIGSEFKIDASYLSPNVNMASRLEAATKQFGVPLLISGALQSICSARTQTFLRLIDRVTVKGSIEPMELFTCDLDSRNLERQTVSEDNEAYETKVVSKMRGEKLRKDAMEGEVRISDYFETDPDLRKMRSTIPNEFLKEFKIGLQLYLAGEWEPAVQSFKRAQEVKAMPDGPSLTLIEFINEQGGRAPPDWPGYRELLEK